MDETFQKCIKATREVGIRYLWIDCLCIIQDSEEDWQLEAGIMEQVYSNCYLNIAASESSNGSEGLFRERDPGSAGSAYVQISDEQGLLCYGRPSLARRLGTRAWVVQERFLSPRTVHYLENRLVWECSESFTLEGLPAGVNLRQNATTIFKQHNGSIATAPLSPDKLYKVYELWDTLVIRYIMGRLSFSSDRPIAVAGIARVICRHLKLAPSDYHSGLWRPRFVEGLCWMVSYCRRKTKQGFINFHQERLSGIPTWSWLSVDREIWQDHCGRSGNCNYTTPPELIELKTVSSGDPFGPVSSSLVRLKGPLCRASISVGSRLAGIPADYNESERWNMTVNNVTCQSPGTCDITFDSCRGQHLGNVLRDPVYLLAVRAAGVHEGRSRFDTLVKTFNP
ncbi:hypothetical protein PG994_009387 [Apiospora phragmitis]|uniref:Heterokaryon incompatibility domain-containing protein n=1 Tax=Apiospora phragmitis TaxID=2905665 RepID=A0ABR1UM54_9PEZI